MVRIYRRIALMALLAALPAAQGQQAVPQTDPQVDFSVGLAPGDIVEAHFLDFPEAADLHLTISPSGTIFVPYAGPVKVAGLMPEQAEAAIVQALKDKQVVAAPQVSLNVVSARNLVVVVLGAVSLPHPIPLFAPAPLSMVLGQVQRFLTENGVTAIDAVGKPFDPALHEAVAKKPTTEVEDGIVLEQHRKGYQLYGKLIRPATVVVAQAAEGASAP